MELKIYLAKYDISRTDFAEKIGVRRSAIWRYLNGHWPRDDIAKRIEQVTEGKVTVKDLHKGRPTFHFICPTCKRRRKQKPTLKQKELF